MNKNYIVLDQYREVSIYNDFIGKFYHFPKKYISYFPKGETEFIYFEPKKHGKGEYFGYGKIKKQPFKDKREDDYYFVELEDYKSFLEPVKGPIETPPYYNPRNAVRKIESELLEKICLDGKIQLNFKADSHLVEVLGEQLIASEKIGVLELIKNSYDAHATYCRVIIEKVEKLPSLKKESKFQFKDFEGPVIVIEDNGEGMDRNIIENGWLRPASRNKTDIKDRIKMERKKALEENRLGAYNELIKQMKMAYKNRIPLGEKGVGRFAVHRLGRKLFLKTKVKEKDYEYILEIDWDKFAYSETGCRDLDSIGITLKRQSPPRDYGKNNSGTQLIIYGGKEGFEWNKEKIEDLNRAILQLNSPNKTDTDFSVDLLCPQLPELPCKQIYEEFEPNIKFFGLVDINGLLDYELEFIPPLSVPMASQKIKDKKFDLRMCDLNYWKVGNKFREPSSGQFFININVWYRGKPWIDGPNAKEFRDYLDVFGGLSIYRDGINIFSAEKSKENDWLGLSRRQIKQAFRISYYHMIGSIELDQKNNLELTDKTNREGLIENKAFLDFKKLVTDIIERIIEREYIAIRDKYSNLIADIIKEPQKLRDITRQGTKIINNIKTLYPVVEDPYKILQEFGLPEKREERLVNLERSLKNLRKSLKAIEESKSLLTEQAGFGLSIAVSIHELAKITSNFYYGINELLKRGYDESKLKELREASLSIKSELNRLSPLRAVRNEKKVVFSIKTAIKYVISVFKTKTDSKKIKIITNYDKDFKIYARYGAVLQIISNLFTNSIYWLETPGLKEKIIKIQFNSEYRYVIIADSGPDIHESIKPYLFEPGYSLKTPPSGLGLYICKYYMQDMKGEIYPTNSRELLKDLPGAQFTLDFVKVSDNKES